MRSSDSEDEDARRRLVGEITQLETLNPAVPAGDRDRKRRARDSGGREGGPCSQLCIGVVNVELVVVGLVLLVYGPDEEEIEESEIESLEAPAEVIFMVGVSCLSVGLLGMGACLCSGADSTLAYAHFVGLLLLTCVAAWAGWFVIGNMALIAREVQVHASNHWAEFLALLPMTARERINATDPGCMDHYTDECWAAVVVVGEDSDPLDLQEDMRIGGGLVALLLVFPLVGLCLAKRRLAAATIYRKTESALAVVSLICGVGLLGLSGFFSSGTHQLVSMIGGWAVEMLALLGVLLLSTSCTLCTGPDDGHAQGTSGDMSSSRGARGSGRTKQCAGRLLVVLSIALTVAVCACFFAQQAVFDAIGKAVSDEELEELLGDLHAIYCADHYSDGDGERPVELNSTAGSWGWEATGDADWESNLDVDFESTELVSGNVNATYSNGTGTSTTRPWEDERDCDSMLAGNHMEHTGLRTWADLSPLVFAWLDTAGRWLVLLLGVTTARAVLLLRCSTNRHEYGGEGRGEYAELNSDQAGVM